MQKVEWEKLTRTYRRWPALAGVAAGLWVLVIMYFGRMLVYLIRGDHRVAGLSLVWSIVCLLLWRLLHAWAMHRPADD